MSRLHIYVEQWAMTDWLHGRVNSHDCHMNPKCNSSSLRSCTGCTSIDMKPYPPCPSCTHLEWTYITRCRLSPSKYARYLDTTAVGPVSPSAADSVILRSIVVLPFLGILICIISHFELASLRTSVPLCALAPDSISFMWSMSFEPTGTRPPNRRRAGRGVVSSLIIFGTTKIISASVPSILVQ
ncbi:hypothetical protein E4T56_gene3120 [Termitomyces sp. T112]|nr:hypothetical protein E4T56_gene3120 [Termitomyces sp. T112]